MNILSEVMISPSELLSDLPISYSQKNAVLRSRKILENILHHEDERLVLIVGPCSIHDEKSTYEYADRLARLAEEVSDKFFIIMRTYFEKPRTKKGWKGLLYDPNLDNTNDIEKGLRLTRKILLTLIDRGLPCGCELLELTTHHYYADLLTWGCIGARTCASQPHRQLASLLPFAVGFKNSTDGNIESALNGIASSSCPHAFLGVSPEGMLQSVKTLGNPHCHLVLRGGDQGPNYERDCFDEAWKQCESRKILVDCAHGNSRKSVHGQMQVFHAMIEEYQRRKHGLLGMMLESHLEEGNQPLQPSLKYGISVTDPCLSFESTRALILEGASRMHQIMAGGAHSPLAPFYAWE